MFLAAFLFFRFEGGLIPYCLLTSAYYTCIYLLLLTYSEVASIGSYSICSTTFRQQPQARLIPGSRPIGDYLLRSRGFLSLA